MLVEHSRRWHKHFRRITAHSVHTCSSVFRKTGRQHMVYLLWPWSARHLHLPYFQLEKHVHPFLSYHKFLLCMFLVLLGDLFTSSLLTFVYSSCCWLVFSVPNFSPLGQTWSNWFALASGNPQSCFHFNSCPIRFNNWSSFLFWWVSVQGLVIHIDRDINDMQFS